MAHANIIIKALEEQFPWLKSEDGDVEVNGGDLVQALTDYYEVLKEEEAKRPALVLYGWKKLKGDGHYFVVVDDGEGNWGRVYHLHTGEWAYETGTIAPENIDRFLAACEEAINR